MQNRAHKFGVAILFGGLFLALVCQVVAPSAGLHGLPESGSGPAFHGLAVCQSPLLMPTASLVYPPHVMAAIAAGVLGEPTPGHTLPFYRPPRSTACSPLDQ
jgi:hypothetical protein